MKKNIIGAALLASIALGQSVPLYASDKSQDLPALKAKKTELEQDVIALKAQDQSDAAIAEQLQARQTELDSVEAQIEAAELKARNAILENAVLAQRSKDAKEAVKSAIKRGAIAPKDTDLQAKWEERCVADPENIELLASMKGSPALDRNTAPTRLIISGGGIEVQKEDIAHVLQAYSMERDAMKRGALYAKEVDGLIGKGEIIDFSRVKLQAANTLGTLVGDIISQRTLSIMSSRRPMLGNVVLDFSNENAKLGQTVTTRSVGLPTVQDFGHAGSDTADVDYDVTMSAHKQVRFNYTAAEYLGTGRNLVAEHAQANATALGNHLVDFIAGLITDAFTSETTGAANAKDYTALTTACKALNTAGAPDFNRFGWVNADFAEALKNDEVVMQNWDKGNQLAYGHWTNIHGFQDIWEYPALPANAVNLIGFFGQQNALLLATRVMINPEALIGAGYPGTIKVVSDPVSGLSVVSNQFINQSDLSMSDRLIILYGGARGLVTAGHKFVST